MGRKKKNKWVEDVPSFDKFLESANNASYSYPEEYREELVQECFLNYNRVLDEFNEAGTVFFGYYAYQCCINKMRNYWEKYMTKFNRSHLSYDDEVGGDGEDTHGDLYPDDDNLEHQIELHDLYKKTQKTYHPKHWEILEEVYHHKTTIREMLKTYDHKRSTIVRLRDARPLTDREKIRLDEGKTLWPIKKTNGDKLFFKGKDKNQKYLEKYDSVVKLFEKGLSVLDVSKLLDKPSKNTIEKVQQIMIEEGLIPPITKLPMNKKFTPEDFLQKYDEVVYLIKEDKLNKYEIAEECRVSVATVQKVMYTLNTGELIRWGK